MNQSVQRDLLDKDRQTVWHPFTQMKDYAERDHLLIEKADGVFLFDANGNRYYDTVSSWWVNVHGHGHPRIKQAIAKTLEKLDHVMFSGLTHAPGIELAERLTRITPPGLSRVFYSDNGSTAVEVAVKMSFQYWRQSGRAEKTKFAFLDNSYHGDTIGAVSVGGVDMYHTLFQPLLFQSYRIPSPDFRKFRSTGAQAEAVCVEHALNGARQVLERHGSEIAGVIVEPMIQAAGGMIIYPAAYLRGLRTLCDEFGVHLIADEVAVGFGRTGKMFGCEHADISPDILCLSKGLTAGIIPLAATLCTEEIYVAFYDDYETLKTFFHGHSFTGNPIAAAVALESLNIFAEEAVLDRMAAAANTLRDSMSRLQSRKHVGNVRSLGMVAAFDLLAAPENGTPFAFDKRTGYAVYLEGLKEGLILRPLGDTIYYWLPLCTTPEQIGDIASRTEKVLDQLEL